MDRTAGGRATAVAYSRISLKLEDHSVGVWRGSLVRGQGSEPVALTFHPGAITAPQAMLASRASLGKLVPKIGVPGGRLNLFDNLVGKPKFRQVDYRCE